MLFKRLGIDLGTANSLVYLAGEGVVLNEPTVVAISIEDNRVVAVGNEAKDMLGRTPGNIMAMRPLKDGVIADYVVTEAMLRYFIDKVCGRSRLFKPEVMICVPAGCTQVERRAVMDATLSAGAKTVYLIEEPLAAAIGAKIPIAQASGNMIVDIGGGSTEAAVISLGGVVVHNSVRVAGNKLDEAITTFIKKKFNLYIGERMAEDVKIQIGTAMPQRSLPTDGKKEIPSKMEVRGRDSVTGMPRMIEITSEEISDALQAPLVSILNGIKGVLEETPPELASDIIDKGIVLSGGTSLLHNFDKLVVKTTGVAVHIAEDPLLCVVRGTGVALENIDLYKRGISRR
ncbi:rod shape-determining protein [Candidatus Gottesmanbacteria bacterium RIFCSPHIGHO2_02_FULL_40_13]|uniref:Cell shape-determining protein MreB n=1 Tax=Candidatus Gottesmanbacteria bacterium RIFCSPHIGHO2_02_FULL_40_13 TaxID=1798384 RepID=A0A1F6A9W2_9BACT|nr:MAG: rod shape-determining protein [Candidatus Gottesmanbacteria bacterium RIFCSPHIGHO2_02_FULL_40_13]